MISHCEIRVAQPQSLDRSCYPRTYQDSPTARVLWTIAAVIVGLGSFWGTGYLLTSGFQSEYGGLALCCVLLAVPVGCLSLAALRGKITLTADGIRKVSAFSAPRHLHRSQIAGWRKLHNDNGSYSLELVPRDKRLKSLMIHPGPALNMDEAFNDWFRTLPDIDKQELEESTTEIVSDPALGSSDGARSGHLHSAKRNARILNGVGLAMGAWYYFYPHPGWLLIALSAALPLLVAILVMQSKGLFRVITFPNDAHPAPTLAFAIPAFILAGFALTRIHPVEWLGLAAMVLFTSCVFTFLLTVSIPKTPVGIGVVLFLLLLVSVYVFGAVSWVNTAFDRSTPQTFVVRVLSKNVSGPDNLTWSLDLPIWGPQEQITSVRVSHAFFNSVIPGDNVCIELSEGALRLPWYQLEQCHSLQIVPR